MAFIRNSIRNSVIRKWVFDGVGYNKYGLLRDDILYETPEIQEALRRVPQSIKDERVYRIQRASQLCLTHTILPKNQWTKLEEDDRYLEPYLKEVQAEIKEKNEWDRTH